MGILFGKVLVAIFVFISCVLPRAILFYDKYAIDFDILKAGVFFGFKFKIPHCVKCLFINFFH